VAVSMTSRNLNVNGRTGSHKMCVPDNVVNNGAESESGVLNTVDMIGTTRFMSDANGQPVAPAAHTAFGERDSGTNHRYGYAGAWGYQAHDEFPFLHVGWRYYDPATGRFLQRDPVGISAVLNAYAYVRNNPLNKIDPSGLWDEGMHDWEVAEDPFGRYEGWGADDNKESNDAFHRGVRKVGGLACLIIGSPWSKLPQSIKTVAWTLGVLEWLVDW